MSSRNLRDTLHMPIRALIPALKGFFFLSNQAYPQSRKDLFEQAALISKTDLTVLGIWLERASIELADIERYLAILQKLMELMETYTITS